MYIVLNHIICVLVCIFAFCFCLWKCLCTTWYLALTSVKVFCVLLSVPIFLSVWLPVLVRPFTFTENSDYDIIFTPVIFQWLVQSQSEWNYCRWFGVNLLVSWCQAFCLCLYLWKICISHHNDFMLPTLHFWRIWSSLIRRS